MHINIGMIIIYGNMDEFQKKLSPTSIMNVFHFINLGKTNVIDIRNLVIIDGISIKFIVIDTNFK